MVLMWWEMIRLVKVIYTYQRFYQFLSIFLFLHLSSLFVYYRYIYLSINPYVFMLFLLSINLFIYLSIYLFINLSTCLFKQSTQSLQSHLLFCNTAERICRFISWSTGHQYLISLTFYTITNHKKKTMSKLSTTSFFYAIGEPVKGMKFFFFINSGSLKKIK